MRGERVGQIAPVDHELGVVRTDPHAECADSGYGHLNAAVVDAASADCADAGRTLPFAEPYERVCVTEQNVTEQNATEQNATEQNIVIPRRSVDSPSHLTRQNQLRYLQCSRTAPARGEATRVCAVSE